MEFLAKDRDSNRRPVLIILSDGRDTISRHCFRDAVDAAMRAEVPIYTLNTGDPKTVAAAAESCGRWRRSRAVSVSRRAPGASSALASVVEDLRKRYVLTYELPNHAEGLHSVSILPTTNSNLRLRSRRAYYYAGAESSAGTAQ